METLEIPVKTNASGHSDEKTFTLYWLDGKRELVRGPTPAEAMSRAGYGGGALRALDFYADGDDTSYQFVDKRWSKKAAVKPSGALAE